MSDGIRNFPSTNLFCRNTVVGEIMVLKDDDTARNMSVLLTFKQRCLYHGIKNKTNFFTGYNDMKEEVVFVDVNTGEKMEWDNWGEYEPNNYCMMRTAQCMTVFIMLCGIILVITFLTVHSVLFLCTLSTS